MPHFSIAKRDLSAFVCLVILLTGFLSDDYVRAQSASYSINGKVVAAESGEALSNVNIYLSQTTIGTTSDPDGSFQLSGIPEGIHELAVSFIGFKTILTTLNTDSLMTDYLFEMQEEVFEMVGVTVTYDRVWEGNYYAFKNNFLGATENSEYSTILNSKSLNFSFDAEALILTAESNEPLKIENQALGYQIDYDLDTFEVDFKRGQNLVAGATFFREMEPSDSLQMKNWEKNRQVSYYGSFQHFIDSLIGDSLSAAGYEISRERRTENQRFIGEDPIPPAAIFYSVNEDTYVLQFNHYIFVTYTKEEVNQRYLNWRYGFRAREMVPGPQSTSIFIEGRTVFVDKSGYISDPLRVFMDGYWSYTKVADLMPLNYKQGTESQ
jgi:hypothetical protein